MSPEPRSPRPRGPGTAGVAGRSAQRRRVLVWQMLSALFLLAMGGIHLYLVFDGTGGVLGVLFLLNAVGGVVLAVAMVVLRRRFLQAATVLSLLFMAGTLLALVLALTVGLFGIRSSLDFQLAPTTLVVESIGTVVLAVTTALVFRPVRSPVRARTARDGKRLRLALEKLEVADPNTAMSVNAPARAITPATTGGRRTRPPSPASTSPCTPRRHRIRTGRHPVNDSSPASPTSHHPPRGPRLRLLADNWSSRSSAPPRRSSAPPRTEAGEVPNSPTRSASPATTCSPSSPNGARLGFLHKTGAGLYVLPGHDTPSASFPARSIR